MLLWHGRGHTDQRSAGAAGGAAQEGTQCRSTFGSTPARAGGRRERYASASRASTHLMEIASRAAQAAGSTARTQHGRRHTNQRSAGAAGGIAQEETQCRSTFGSTPARAGGRRERYASASRASTHLMEIASEAAQAAGSTARTQHGRRHTNQRSAGAAGGTAQEETQCRSTFGSTPARAGGRREKYASASRASTHLMEIASRSSAGSRQHCTTRSMGGDIPTSVVQGQQAAQRKRRRNAGVPSGVHRQGLGAEVRSMRAHRVQAHIS